MPNGEGFLLGALGAAAMELIKLYERYETMKLGRFKAMVRSGLFWGVEAGLVLGSGFLAWAMHAQAEKLVFWQVVMTGIAARTIARESLTIQQAGAETKLGGETVTLRDIFLGDRD